MEGGCQCGWVRYRITQAPFATVACHCTECQRQSGGAFSLSLIVPKNAFEFDREKTASFTRSSDSGREVKCVFCPKCGTRIVHEPNYEHPVVNVRAGTLDDTSAVQPVAHTWVKSKQAWVEIPAASLSYGEQPTGEEFISDLKRRQGDPSSV